MSHTPGPWEARGGYVCDSKAVTLLIAENAYRPEDEAIANAVLAAAAPELLEALEKAREVLKETRYHLYDKQDIDRVRGMAEEIYDSIYLLITKAKGQQ